MVCSAASGYTQQQITFNGNRFLMSGTDTMLIIDPVTGVEITRIIPPHPVSMNGKRIYPTDTLKVFPSIKSTTGDDKKLSVYLFENLKAKLDMLEDGNYTISVTNAVIDSKGKLVYYEFGGIQKLITKTVFIAKLPNETVIKKDDVVGDIIMDTTGNLKSFSTTGIPHPDNDTAKAYSRVETRETDMGIDQLQKEAINAAAKDLLENVPKMIPAEINHVKVNCTGPVFSSWNYIVVKDHTALFSPFYDTL